MESIDILAMGAHPDDIELACSGTLMKMVDRGYSLGILDLTQGEVGTGGTQEIRAQEAEAARAVIGARFRERLNLGDSRLTASIENRFALAEKIRLARPKTVILPYWEGRHPDHYTAATLGYEACYAAGLKRLPIAGGGAAPSQKNSLRFDVLGSPAVVSYRHQSLLCAQDTGNQLFCLAICGRST